MAKVQKRVLSSKATPRDVHKIMEKGHLSDGEIFRFY